MINDKERHRFTVLEKAAIAIIIILIIAILLLVFKKQIQQYLEEFKAWYESA